MGQTLMTVVKLVVFLPLVLALILWLGKLAEKYSSLGGRRSSMKIVDRLSLSKDNALFVVKLGDKLYFVASAAGRVEIVRELDEKEAEEYKLSQLPKFTDTNDKSMTFKRGFFDLGKIFKTKE